MKRTILMIVAGGVVVAAILRPPGPPAISVKATSGPLAVAARRRPAEQKLVVYVAGAVEKPGLYRLAAGSRAVDGVRIAGGFRADADPSGVNLAAPLEDGMEIVTPVAGTHRAAGHGIRRAAHHRTAKSKAALTSKPQTDARIDLNAADAATLEQLPGIGAELALRLVRFREVNGSFASLDELADVAGMTPRKIEAIVPYLQLGP
ncbi:MAG: ComEA family DNA-binding protein [Candidatus Eremiobacteraeota bacterium]|nr:ComEA family DNA-binding protein [Candidatus Eremiobacteraeota bacterium]